MRSWIRVMAAAGVAAAVAACGGDGPGGPSAAGSMSATIDGQAWSAATINRARSGSGVMISGTGQGLTVNLIVTISEPGTVVIEPGPNLTNLNVSEGAQAWVASGALGSGSITFNTLTDAGAAGTFAFTGDLSAGSSPIATRTVTQGTFQVTF